jgi:hypothetical protein
MHGRIPTTPQFTFLSLLAVFVANWMISPVNASDPLPRIEEASSKEIEAGDEVTVSLDRPLSNDLLPMANIGDRKIDAVQVSTDRTKITVRVPAQLVPTGKPESDYRLTFSAIKGQETVQLGGQRILTVYPRGSPKAESINDVVASLTPYIRPGETFTVKGSDFFAPKSAIKFYVHRKESIEEAITESIAADGSSFTAAFKTNANLEVGDWPYEITVWGCAVSTPYSGHVLIEDTRKFNGFRAAMLAFLPVGFFVVGLYFLSLGLRRVREHSATLTGGALTVPRNWLETLLVDPATNTYSLSRLQFLLWLFALVYAYAFVFVARAQVANVWNFPNFSGSEIAFLISLGTLVGSIATTTIIGPKGAGEIRPTARDFIVHGGVVALDRIQQLLWTIVAIWILISILIRTAGTMESVPTIPDELLTLMGASSVGYLAGKAARKPGPIISRVFFDAAGLHVGGMNLSTTARVFVNGKEHVKGYVVPGKQSQNRPDEFAGELLLQDAEKCQGRTSIGLMNPDGQEAQWEGECPVRQSSPRPNGAKESPGSSPQEKPQ